jgi:hypothetical protein
MAPLQMKSSGRHEKLPNPRPAAEAAEPSARLAGHRGRKRVVLQMRYQCMAQHPE